MFIFMSITNLKSNHSNKPFDCVNKLENLEETTAGNGGRCKLPTKKDQTNQKV